MARTVDSPYEILAAALEQVINSEFGDDSPKIIVHHDRIHESLGANGRDYVGISPEREIPANITLRIEALVQFYGAYSLEVNPEQIVDPRVIAKKAERFRQAVQAARIVAMDKVWYMNLEAITYPNDATGNKSRFEAIVSAQGTNSGLVETTG